jgi:predicted phosphodiesterase
MKWTTQDDHALIAIASTSTSVSEVLRRLEMHFHRPITTDAADKRIRRATGKSLHASLGCVHETEIPVIWEDDDGPRTEPGPPPDNAPKVAIPPPPPVARVETVPAASLSSAGDYTRVLVVPDTHAPYHDKAAWALMLRAARVLQPDIIVHLGDLADFYAVSFHDKDPNRRRNLEWEVGETKRCLDDLDALGAKRRVITLGNHEHRLARYLAQKAPELFNMIRTEELLELDARGWETVAYRDSVKIGHVHFTHEEGSCGALAHIKARATFETNVVIGHTHAMGMQFQRNALGTAHVSASFGWLGDFEAIDYTHRAKALRWQLGFGLGLMQPDGTMHLHPCPIVKGKVDVLGRLVT